MTIRAKPQMLLIRLLKRSLLAGLFALTLAGAGQAAADTISITGDIGVTFTALGAGQISGTPALTYATAGPVLTAGATKRAVTVRLLEALPPGVTVTVSFAPDSGHGLSTGTLTLSTVVQVLVDLIDADIEQTAKTLHYTIYTSKGFSSVSIKIEYALIDK